MAYMPFNISSDLVGSGWENIPLYPTPRVRGLLVYILGTSTSFSLTFSFSLPSLSTYSKTGLASCAEHGPTIISIFLLSPLITSDTSLSRSALIFLRGSGNGTFSIISSGSGIFFCLSNIFFL